MPKKSYNVGYLNQRVVDNSTNDLTATNNKVLEGETFIGADNVKTVGTIPTFNGETETASMTIKELIDAKGNADYLFYNYKGDTIPIGYDDTENAYSMNGMFQNCDVKSIPNLNTINVQYMNNMYNGSTATIIGGQPQPRMLKMARRNLSSIEQFMQEIGKLDEWNSLMWSNITLSENTRSVVGLLANAVNVENVKIINDSLKLKKLYANALGNNRSLKTFWVTNCNNIEEGIDGIVRKCPALETIVLEKASSEKTIPDLDGITINSPTKYLYIDGLHNLVSSYGFVANLENLEHVKLLGCANIENLESAAIYNKKIISYVLENPHIKNISMAEFTTYKGNNITYNVPYLEYFEPGCIIYSMNYERYYKIKEDKTFERITDSIEDYINKYNGGIDNAPMLKINQSMNSRSNLLQASLDCFLKGAILYSTVDKKYYKKDLISGDWVVVDEPLNYPLKQSLFTLKELDYAFYNAENLEKFIISDASDIGKTMKTRNVGGTYRNLQSNRINSIQCKGYENNFDLPFNYDKLKYFVPGTVFHWLDTDTYYEIDKNHNAIVIDLVEYLKTHDILPTIITDYTYKVKVNINKELSKLYNSYPDVDPIKGAFVYDQHSRSFYKIYEINTINKNINNIDINNFQTGAFVISSEKKCYKKIGNNWVESNIFYTLPNNEIIGIPQRYGAEEISLDTYLNTLFVFETDYFSNSSSKQEMLKDFGADNVIRTTNDDKLYKIVYNETYDIEEIDETYLEGKNILTFKITGTYALSIKESINFNKVVKHFEIYGVEILDNRFGLSNDWQDFWYLSGGTSNTFKGCTKLKELILPGISISFDISDSVAFEEQDILQIFNNLGVITTRQTITLNTKYNNLPEDIKSIALNKGWTIVFN